ncbi:hypothetical protein [Azotosporobacter soli]|uniref:hypothetical protein n=1 Tax=Azotosporobacter soli TaxID=3055040 RepID=UPI0031FEB7F3
MIIKSLADRLFTDFKSDVKGLAEDLGDVVGGQVSRVVRQGPVKVIKDVVEDAGHAIFGQDGPHPIRDAVSFVEGVGTIAADTAINIFNALPGHGSMPVVETLPGSINAEPNKVIADAHYHSEASLGDLSWLIYKAKMVTNTQITDKWKLYNDVETSHGYNSRTYIDEANKQVAITLEGTQPNSKLSPLWLSKDGLTDLEIGLGVIPPQMREGYEAFKKIVADVENKFVAQGYGLSVAGHSLGGGLAQLLSGMYFIDTGKALPTVAEAGPGMLRQLEMYAEQQLLAGETIHLPTGGTYKLHAGTLLQRANEAKALVAGFKSEDFSNVVNLITDLDPVGHVNYNVDPSKDGHVGVDIIAPHFLTAREDLQDIEYVALKPVNEQNITTPSTMPHDPLGIMDGLHDISATRFDRHEPDQSDALWSGTAVGLKDFDGDIGLGTAVFRDYGPPKKVWTGSDLTIAEVKLFADNSNSVINVKNAVHGKQNAAVFTRDGNHIVFGSDNGDQIVNGAGNQTIYAGKGDNYIYGGSGNSLIYGGGGHDIIYAGSGNNVIVGGSGDSLLFGGTGNNTFVWSAGNDIIRGGSGNDTITVKAGASGDTQIKWERNFKNFGNDIVSIEGAMEKTGHLTFNFVDEIRFGDMQWSQNGADIVMTDNKGDKTATVTFKNALDMFAANDNQLDFKFTNGRLYQDDELYHVRAGKNVAADASGAYKGSILIGTADGSVLTSGSGNDLLFGGKGHDAFVFENNFGHDQIAVSDADDTVRFNQAFNVDEFSLLKKGNDLVIDYQQRGLPRVNELMISNWAVGDKVNQFSFSDGLYKIDHNQFVKVS